MIIVLLIILLNISKTIETKAQTFSIGDLFNRINYLESLQNKTIKEGDYIFENLIRPQNRVYLPPEIRVDSILPDSLASDQPNLFETIESSHQVFEGGIEPPKSLVYFSNNGYSYGLLKSIVSPNEDLGFYYTTYSTDTIVICFPLSKWEDLSFTNSTFHIIYFVNRKIKGHFSFINGNPTRGLHIKQMESKVTASYLKDSEIAKLNLYETTSLDNLVIVLNSIDFSNTYPEMFETNDTGLDSLFSNQYKIPLPEGK